MESYIQSVLPNYKLDDKAVNELNAEADSGVVDDEANYDNPVDDDDYNPDDDPDAAVWSH